MKTLFRFVTLAALLACPVFGQQVYQNMQAPSGTYTDNSVPRRDGTANRFQSSLVTISDLDGLSVPGPLTLSSTLTIGGVTSTGVTGTGNLVFSASPTFTGTLTLNNGALTFGANFVGTRAVGVAAAGTNETGQIVTTATGDAGGTSYIQSFNVKLNPSGSAAFDTLIAGRFLVNTAGSTNITGSIRGLSNGVTHEGTGLVAQGIAFLSRNGVTSSGNMTLSDNFIAATPSYSSTGATTTARGFAVENQGNSKVGSIVAFQAEDQSGNTGSTYGFRSDISSGANKYGAYFVGTADNFFQGNTEFAGNIYVGAGTNDTYITSDGTLNGQYSSNALGTLYINYYGYNGGTTQFRDLSIHDGKAAVVATFTGSTKAFAPVGVITASSTSSHVFGTTNTVSMTAGALSASASIAVGGGSAVDKILTATAALDFGNILAAASADLTITVTGAAVGDNVLPGLPADPDASLSFDCFVSATNTVTIRAHNVGSIAVDQTSKTFRATIVSF